MLDTPHIARTTAQKTAFIHLIVPREEIQHVMGPGIGELMATIAAQGIGPAATWFTHHRRRPTETFDFEISVPVNATVAAAGRVEPGEWPAMTVARAVHQGSYEGLAEAWGSLIRWIEKSGHQRTADLWERYLVGPETTADSTAWRTELNQQLAD